MAVMLVFLGTGSMMPLTKVHHGHVDGILHGLLIHVGGAGSAADLLVQAITLQRREVLLHYMLAAPLDLSLEPAGSSM